MTKNKKSLTLSFKLIILQLGIIVFFTLTWLSGLIFNIGVFNIWYFLFMFIGLIGFVVITLYSKGKPEQLIPKNLTQHFGNLIKTITDIINIQIIKQTPAMTEIKNIIQKALVWSLREAKISPEFDRKTLEDAEKYMFDNLLEERE